jgi:hypothetical protein
VNKLYRMMAEAAAERALAAAKHVDVIEHAGLKGRARELFVSELLPPVLSPTMSVCTGLIIDAHGGQSQQTDVIVFDRRIAPPLQLSASTGEAAVPCESVLFAVEVKTRLTNSRLRDAIDWAHSVKDRKFSPQVFQPVVINRIDSVPCALFAYETDLCETSGIQEEWRRLQDVVAGQSGEVPLKVPLSSVVIATRGNIECVDARNPPHALSSTRPRGRSTQSSDSLPGSRAMLRPSVRSGARCHSMTISSSRRLFVSSSARLCFDEEVRASRPVVQPTKAAFLAGGSPAPAVGQSAG